MPFRHAPFLLAALGLAASGAGCRGIPPSEPPVLFKLPAFTLVERSGTPATLDALRGQPWIADFIFTRCAGVCPAMTARMSALRARLAGVPVRFVSFTVDPGNDTPEVLRRYADGVGAGADWWFVTGPKPDLYALSTEGFKLAAMENAPGAETADGPFLHSSKFVLVDGNGAIRAYYDSEDEADLRALEADARRLAAR
jgi:cytochrome oxidase Cu insertion factor (SCO1/SenC/PrrC family)